jgi:hypothetical protein
MGGGSGGRREAERSLQGLRQQGLLGDSADRASRDPSLSREAVDRHCWVTNAAGVRGRWPGIVLEWRRHEGRWQGRAVAVVLNGEDQQDIYAWFDQDDLAPAERR